MQKCLHFCIAEPNGEGLHSSPLKGKYRRISSKERRGAFFFILKFGLKGTPLTINQPYDEKK